MKLEYYRRRVGRNWEQVTEREVYDCPEGKHGKILLVENEAELEIQEAMQMIYGSEIKMNIWNGETEPNSYLNLFSWVFATWDPSDRNRI